MTTVTTPDHWIHLEGSICAADIRHLGSHGHIEKLSLVNMPTLTARIAQGFSALPSADQLWLWCDVTRTAMRHVISIPGLRILDVLAIVKPGRLPSFSAASSLDVFRGNHYMTEEDVLQVCTCKSLRELGAQGAALSSTAFDAILDLPRLTVLDLESSTFDDAMAEQISASTVLTALDVGATRMTGASCAGCGNCVRWICGRSPSRNATWISSRCCRIWNIYPSATLATGRHSMPGRCCPGLQPLHR